MADGTLKVGTITTSSGSGTITIGQSGETITIPTGTTVSGAMSNKPAFEAQLSGVQSLTDDATTKVTFQTKNFDTNNYYDNSTNYRFTPLVAGKYLVYSNIDADPLANTQLQNSQLMIYKNGSEFRRHEQNFTGNYVRRFSNDITAVIDMNGTTDYLEMFVRINDTSGNPQLNDLSGLACYFGAYKLIGVE
jgi:hypothetical protein